MHCRLAIRSRAMSDLWRDLQSRCFVSFSGADDCHPLGLHSRLASIPADRPAAHGPSCVVLFRLHVVSTGLRSTDHHTVETWLAVPLIPAYDRCWMCPGRQPDCRLVGNRSVEDGDALILGVARIDRLRIEDARVLHVVTSSDDLSERPGRARSALVRIFRPPPILRLVQRRAWQRFRWCTRHLTQLMSYERLAWV